jgi:hypothetical protein
MADMPPYINVCAKRIGEGLDRAQGSTWCTKPDGHEPPCEGPPPTVHDPATFAKGLKK